MFATTQANLLAPLMVIGGALALALISLLGWYGGLFLGIRLVKVSAVPRRVIALLLDVCLLFAPLAVQDLVVFNNYFALTSIVFGGLLGAHLGIALTEQKTFNKLAASDEGSYRFLCIAVITIVVCAITQVEVNISQQATITQLLCAIASAANLALMLLTGVFVGMIASGERRKQKVVRTTMG